MKRETTYEWRYEETRDGNIVDVCANESNSLIRCVCGELKDYGSNNRDDLEPYWEICLNKRVGNDEEGVIDEDWFYLELVDGKFQFNPNDSPPKRFKAQVEKLNKELA